MSTNTTVPWRNQVSVSTRGAIGESIRAAVQQFNAHSIQEAIELAMIDWYTRQGEIATNLAEIRQMLSQKEAN